MPALNIQTDTSKVYPGFPQHWNDVTDTYVGHRITQFLGRQIVVTTDDSVVNSANPIESFDPEILMLGHPKT